ncbi:hypothetical protein EDD21DRAFT_411228 [Dissophora ornata]|nr:hypothetical protein BGZ58_010763 [Dissophora ornata]KAI8605310.1 hypothetical protein EDD21DRAFT_411228 [Dissophora ornata]
MKFFSVLAVLATAALVSAQSDVDACATCLQSSLQALPLCASVNITMGELNPEGDAVMAACLCSSLNGTWVDACTGDAQCGQDIVSFKNAYSDNIQSAGLSCGTTPSFAPSSTA